MSENAPDSSAKAFVTVLIPCCNDEAILETNLEIITDFLRSRNNKYLWELLIINDGSSDNTRNIAEDFAKKDENVKIFNHPVNLKLGRTLQTGFHNANGEIIVVFDPDLSFAVEYIEQLIDRLIEDSADIVIASPYMKGGKVTAVPLPKKFSDKWVNKLMSFSSQDKYYTFTCMVRAYRSSFIQALNLKTKDYEVNPEILYKAMILRARIIEIPAHLDWTGRNKYADKRSSGLGVVRSFFSGIMSSFIFRPYIFFMAVGIMLILISFTELFWLLNDTLSGMHILRNQSANIEYLFSASLLVQFKKNPQSFIVGGISFIVAVQFLSLGFLSLQSKRYFEELFHLGTAQKKQNKKMQTS